MHDAFKNSGPAVLQRFLLIKPNPDLINQANNVKGITMVTTTHPHPCQNITKVNLKVAIKEINKELIS